MSKSELKRLCAQNQSVFDMLLRCLPESPYRDRFTSAIEKLEDMAKQQKETIDELEQRVKVLTDALEEIASYRGNSAAMLHVIAQQAIDATPKQTTEQIERWHVEWLHNQIPTLYMQSNHVDAFVRKACGSDSMLARCSYRQLHADYIPLIAIPQLPETKEPTK